jgi:hypothetical protein
LLPRGTDVRDIKDPAGADVCEIPANTGRFYDVVWVDDLGLGFPNEHRFAEVIGKIPWPVPFPDSTITPPTGLLDFLIDGGDAFGFSGHTLDYNTGPGTVVMALLFVDSVVEYPVITSTLLGILTPVGGAQKSGGGANTFGHLALIWAHPGGADSISVAMTGTSGWRALLYLSSYTVNNVNASASGYVDPVSVYAGGSTTDPSAFMFGMVSGTVPLDDPVFPPPMGNVLLSPVYLADDILQEYVLAMGVFWVFGIGTPALTVTVDFDSYEAWTLSVHTLEP